MPEIESSVVIDRPLDVVWDLWTDVRRLPELSASTTAVEAPERLDRAGQTFRQHLDGVGRSMVAEWTVEEVVEGSHLVVTSRPLPGVDVRLTERVEDVGTAGSPRTRATLTVAYRLPFGPASALVSRLGVERRARREAEEVVDGLDRLLRT